MRAYSGLKTFLLLVLSGLVIPVLSSCADPGKEITSTTRTFQSVSSTDFQEDSPVFYKSIEQDSSRNTEPTYHLLSGLGKNRYEWVDVPSELPGLAGWISGGFAIFRLRLILFPFHFYD
ncbi:hypothetical protein [Cyclobacterium salsum]|uniref:hypothetical protein n=1 Tax=Cyclobacterium salsum TaxID=2666329 RepID=UPI001391DEBB|nr:hypothetical protein [Cyclobacterium salsum]